MCSSDLYAFLAFSKATNALFAGTKSKAKLTQGELTNQLNTIVHNHKMALIQIENYDPNNKYVIHCKSCKCNIKNDENFY